MSKESKQIRKENQIDARTTKNENKINTLENEFRKLKKDYDVHILRHIKDDLQQERFPGSGKPLYTYDEIAERHNSSASTINRIAGEHGLLRRGNKSLS
ncbi:hypothetical protein BC351_33190 [Paenibacillus ferrarius]|uniref:Uncharacterized protein n=1 Tax=Paenibacillus ferrarius TaxID=1469647 RepID=A0A1V4HF55_9BACL|nr:hypothetical protein [Paenibacillus ferrarius]OPH52190.1 hypothetical protein BC351_33190 [Paenibacillus ferrarius]